MQNQNHYQQNLAPNPGAPNQKKSGGGKGCLIAFIAVGGGFAVLCILLFLVSMIFGAGSGSSGEGTSQIDAVVSDDTLGSSSDQIAIDTESLSTELGLVSNIKLEQHGTSFTQSIWYVTGDFTAKEENGTDRHAYLVSITAYDSDNRALQTSDFMTAEIAGGETGSFASDLIVPDGTVVDRISVTSIMQVR